MQAFKNHLYERLSDIASEGYAVGFGFSPNGLPDKHECTYNQRWQDFYWGENLILRDPIIAFGVHNLGAVRWSDVEKSGKDNAVSLARDFGMKNGLVLSVSVDGKRAIAGLATGANLSDVAVREARSVLSALQAFHEGQSGLKLSARQIEVLKLIADGATAASVAHELEIDVSTVNFHKRAALIANRGRAKNFQELITIAAREYII